MSHSDKFSQQINDFERYGTYTYKFDEAGNLVLNTNSDQFSQVYLAFPLGNFVYDNSKIKSFYDPTFTEFVPASQVEQQKTEAEIRQMQEDLIAEKEKTTALTQQLDILVAENESDSSVADDQATKQVIIELRKELGQGNVESDFSEDFPYTPLRKETRE